MTAFEAAILYIGLHVLLFAALKVNVGRVRQGEKIGFGDGANERLQRAIRVQGNAVEDVPILLVGLLALAALSAPVWLIHGLGGALFLGRVLHAVGLGGSSGASMGRLVGTLISLIVTLVIGGAYIWFAVT